MNMKNTAIIGLVSILIEVCIIVPAGAQPTSFHAYGWVSNTTGQPLDGPNVTITNFNTTPHEVFIAENASDNHYYPVIISSYNVSASDVLNFSVTDNGNTTSFNYTVKQDDMTDGGLFEQNISFGNPDLVISDVWVCWPDNCTICYNLTNVGIGKAPLDPNHNTTLYVNGSEKAHDHVDEILLSGETYTRCFDGYTWTYTGVLPDGTMAIDNITVVADSNKVIGESNEGNNSRIEKWMCGDCDWWMYGEVNALDYFAVFDYILNKTLNCTCQA